ncbi:hypothetical protein PUN28_011524 [Cardiocondyla obscurior]|uniref:CRAL-TRIO domain-containing protein n=1 Tax=Cardiocondyla obscurior TaxID=286306 RepID=A0AAW2FGV3_9HYME
MANARSLGEHCDQDHISQELSDEDKKYAAEWLNETDETKRNGIETIRCWLEQNDLGARIDDFIILRFLRVSKFDVEKTKKKMQNRYKQLFKLPEWFLNKDPFLPELQKLLDLGICLMLLKPDKLGRLVMIIQPCLYDPTTTTIADFAKVCLIMMELGVKYYPAASVYGIIQILIMDGLTLRHITQYTPSVIINSIQVWQNYPMRMRSINIVNAPKIFEATATMLKSLMSEKLRNRFHVRSDFTTENGLKDVPAEILPVEYGGTGSTVQELSEFWKRRAEENRDYILNGEK